MNLVRTMHATFLGDGLANAASCHVRDLPDANFVSAPEGAVSLTEDVTVEGVNGYWVYLSWKKKPKKGELKNVTLQLVLPQG